MNNTQDFKESTAFELLLLQTIFKAGESSIQETKYLTRSDGIIRNLAIGLAMSDNDVKDLKIKLLPLAFAAGWKIIDLIIEYELNLAGNKRPKITIKEKQKHALDRDIAGSSLKCEQPTWYCILDLYAHTVEHRHLLVHRKAQVDFMTGDLNGINENTKQALTVLTRDEQLAFANTAVLAAHGILEGGIQQRDEAFLKYHLNLLTHHSKAGILSEASAPEPIAIKIDMKEDDQGWFLELKTQLGRINQNELTDYFDVIIEHPRNPSLKMLARSESMPHDKVYIDLNNPPSWLGIERVEKI
jgi:hypothetical protein